ncbi:TPA: hypothetical protein EYP66_10470 [Candidatus Poribacteria bacterium]|nr:hypothetical protein [Candidatus Poribacteria bacterium]
MIILSICAFMVLMMIIAGVLLSKLAEISTEDKGKYTWIWGGIIIIAILVIPLLILSIIVILIQYPELSGAFKILLGQEE